MNSLCDVYAFGWGITVYMYFILNLIENSVIGSYIAFCVKIDLKP